jgi:phosphoribosylamine--glycine ligase
MRVLVVGGGGREHALAWKIKQSPRCSRIFCAPGNGGISDIAECVAINATDIQGMVRFAKQNRIDMTIVAPDDPLALGMVDALESCGLRAFGPRKNAAIIESSKVFAKDLMRKYEIPTAEYKSFTDYSNAIAYLEKAQFPIVIKADGLALGKGVIIANDYTEASQAIDNIMNKKIFGNAGLSIIIESFITGSEVSVLAFTDGKTIVPMVSAKDHKRAYDGNMGPNTGGMGVFAPCSLYNPEVAKIALEKIIEPTIKAMNSEGRPFSGILYFGLMLTLNGPLVLEYNARFGDPETQAILPLLQTDLLDVFDAVLSRDLAGINIKWEDKASACVVLASQGYPGEYKKGYEISGIDDAEVEKDVFIFHSGTTKVGEKYYTNGGRVIGVTAMDGNLEKAVAKAYRSAQKISFEGMHYRKDIGKV